MGRHLAANAISFLILGLIVLLGLITWGKDQYAGPGPLANTACFEVPSGSSFRRVSDRLADAGIISNATIFRIGANYQNRSDDLKAGSYLVEPGASMEEVVALVTSAGRSTCGSEVVYRIGVNSLTVQLREFDGAAGGYATRVEFSPETDAVPEEITEELAKAETRIRLAVAEGATNWQIAQALGKAEFLTGEVGELPEEGRLAPDSYEVRRGDSRASVIARMAEAQEGLIRAAWEEREADLPVESPEELLVLASIIEKETGVAEERGVVSSVFVNRLRQGMKLQTDPTVIYGITGGEGVLGRGLRRSELDRETPYNTYFIDGLPPGPIANPGRAALQAAANPDDTSYLFFVADGSGGHAFAETLEEHNANVARWREIEAERTEGE